MRWVKFSLAVLATSVALTVAVFATGAVLVSNAVASGIAGARGAAIGQGMDPRNLPPELASLKDIPAAERFSHFKGVQVSLTDKDGKPMTVTVTPGLASAASTNSLTITGNDGASHTYTVTDQTFTRGTQPTNGQNVVVVTINDSSTARAVLAIDPNGWHHNG